DARDRIGLRLAIVLRDADSGEGGSVTLSQNRGTRLSIATCVFSLRKLIVELENSGHLLRLDDEVDASLEAAEIHRRVYARGGPAILYASVKGCRFPMVSNLFGTVERARYLFRHTYENVR